MGILLPLVVAAFGFYRILHPRRLTYLMRTPTDPHAAIGVGVCALGIALFVHALGFVPYERIPYLKYLLAAAGVALFIYGLYWPSM